MTTPVILRNVVTKDLFLINKFYLVHFGPVFTGEVNAALVIYGNAVEDVSVTAALLFRKEAFTINGGGNFAGMGVYYHYGICEVDVCPYFAVYPFKFIEIAKGAAVKGYLKLLLKGEVGIKEKEVGAAVRGYEAFAVCGKAPAFPAVTYGLYVFKAFRVIAESHAIGPGEDVEVSFKDAAAFSEVFLTQALLDN